MLIPLLSHSENHAKSESITDGDSYVKFIVIFKEDKSEAQQTL